MEPCKQGVDLTPACGSATVDVAHCIIALRDGLGDGGEHGVEFLGRLVPLGLRLVISHGGLAFPSAHHGLKARLQVCQGAVDATRGGVDIGCGGRNGTEFVLDLGPVVMDSLL